MKPEFFYNFGIFMAKMSMRHGVCLSWLLGTHFSLKRLVVFVDFYFITHVHSMLDHTMLLFGVICVILMPIMLVHVLIMHMLLILIHLYL